MGRKVTKLLPFIRMALQDKKYENLRYEDNDSTAFILILPRKTKSLKYKYMQILQDWDRCNGRKFDGLVDYSDGKSRLEGSLFNSPFFKPLSPRGEIMKFRFNTDAEIIAARHLKKCKNKKDEKEPIVQKNSPSSDSSSGHGSEMDESFTDISEGRIMYDDTLLRNVIAVCHDHSFGYVLGEQNPGANQPTTEQEHLGISEQEVNLENLSDVQNEEIALSLLNDFDSEGSDKRATMQGILNYLSATDDERMPLVSQSVPDSKHIAENQDGIIWMCIKHEKIDDIHLLICKKMFLGMTFLAFASESKAYPQVILSTPVAELVNKCNFITSQLVGEHLLLYYKPKILA